MASAVLAMALGASIAGPAVAAPAPAGTAITNQASATYFNEAIGAFETVESNTVTAEVLPVPALHIVGGQVLRMARSSQNQYNFRIENTGNVPLDVSSSITELTGDNFDVAGVLYHDRNGNGVLDNGELPIAGGSSISLPAGDAIPLIYLFRTPASVVADDLSISRLSVTGTPQVGPNTPIILNRESRTIIDDAALLLIKSASLREDVREIDYTIVARNNAESAIAPYDTIDGEAITVDGILRTGVLVRDTVPLNTEFRTAVPSGGFTPVYHRNGDDTHSYLSVVPFSLADVDAVAFVHDGAYDTGRSSDLRFTVRISPTIRSATIPNTAVGYIDTGTGTQSRESNEVITPVTGGGQTITFKDGTGGTSITSTPFNENVLVEIGAASCNISSAVDTVEVTITTASLGDVEVTTARETGPNTGVFLTAPIGVIRSDRATPRNNVLEGLPGDSAGARATAVCLGETLTTELGLQPGGFVFDSVTNAPVRGARVVVFDRDADPSDPNATPVAVTTTDALGYFDLGAIAPGDYQIEVFPPEQYQYPSVRNNFDGFNRRVDSAISYGGVFSFNGGPIANIDIPLDPALDLPLTLDKTANRTTSRRGGAVIYTLTARNRMAQALLNAEIEDTLPKGFLYIDGSARLNDEPFEAAPVLAAGGVLTFDIDRIAPGEAFIITYAVRVGTAAGRGKKVNTAVLRGAQAGTGTLLASQAARSTVTVDDRGGVFSDEAVVIGRVFLDRDGDGIQDGTGEPGVPGVKIVTSTGLSVVTDSEGRYSLFGLRPITHTFALQKGTLPVAAEPMAIDIDDLRAPGSRLIDLKRGELRAEDFPLIWTKAAATDVAARIERFAGLEKGESFARDDLPLSFDAEERNSSRGEAGLDTRTELLTKDGPAEAADTERAQGGDSKQSIEDAVKNADPALGIVGLKNGDTLDRNVVTLRVKSPAEAKIGLEVNGESIPDSKIGAKAIHRSAGVQMFEYVAVRLSPDANTITATLSDPFGNVRGREEITVFAPGVPVALQIIAPEQAPANARARIPVVVRVVDAKGRIVRVPADVTLTAENGRWNTDDIRDSIPGKQAHIDNGEATFDFIPPDLVGSERLGVEADFAGAQAVIGFIPDLEERVFVGVIEGAVRFGEDGSRLEGLLEKDDISAFEETTQGVRGQLYLKGKILGENLLTLRYDSDQDSEERLFRDIRRDEFYPVYGDNSERGFDAQSSTGLYVKIEREQSYLLYGDVAIEAQTDAIRLGAYRRSLTGGRAHIEHGPVTVDLFVAETDEQQRVIEVRGRGVSGPYDIDLNGLTEGTEVVELLVRDRDQPSVILSAQKQTRLSDYTIDFFLGTLIFNRPVPQLDDDLNPVSIRVTYETEDGAGDSYFVYGGEVRVEPVEGVAIGYREVRSTADRALDDRRIVRSGYAEADLKGWGSAQIELAQTENNLGERGEGVRASYDYRNDRHAVRVEAARTDEVFDAPNSYVAAGREEVRVTTSHTITDKIDVNTDALYTRATETGERRRGAEVKGRYRVSDQLDAIAGTRFIQTDRTSGDDEVLSGIVGVEWRPVQLPGASLRAEYEQDFNTSENWRLLLGGDYQWSPALRFYALNEISSTESGFFGIGDGADSNFVTKIGAEYQVTDEISGFSEYRESGGLGTDGGVANGFRGQWTVSEHLALRAGIEHVEPISDTDSRSSSASFGSSYENDAKGLIWRNDVEADRDERGLGFYTNTAVSYDVNSDLTVLLRNRFALDMRGEDRLRDRLRFGLAYRPEHDSRIKALALYEYEIDDDQTTKEEIHRWSFGGTYGPTEDLRLNARYSGEWFDIEGPGFSDANTLHLVRAGVEYEFANDRFSIGGHAALFADGEGDDVTAGVGAEVKANVAKNVQISVGYNHIDVDEGRLRDLYQSGFYARVRLKLDENLWDAF